MSLRAFIPFVATRVPDEEIILCADESHYLVRVRRTKADSMCELLDRKGGRFIARVLNPDPKACRVRIQASMPVESTPQPIELWLGMPDGPALLAALSRATELGASRVLLLKTHFSQGRLPSSTRIARCFDAAMRQCGRPDAPALEGPLNLEQALQSPFRGQSWLASPEPSAQAQSLAESEITQRVAIGPEGGFSASELQRLEAAGFLPFGLSPFVLRTEVAVTAALARLHRPSSRT